jgi:hypothetical protein
MRYRKRVRNSTELTKREKNEIKAKLAQFRAMEARKLRDDCEAATSAAQHDGSERPECTSPKRLDVESLTEAARHYNPHAPLEIERLIEAFGTDDRDFIWSLVNQLISATARSTLGRDALAFIFAIMKSEKPKSHLEVMLISQMAATHLLAMKLADQLNDVRYLKHQDSAERAYNKLMRTFTNQLEALKRYRTGGEQKVTVQHVSVSEGGQAIVGHLTHSVSGASESAAPTRATLLTDARQAAMPTIDAPEYSPVPVQRRRTSDR